LLRLQLRRNTEIVCRFARLRLKFIQGIEFLNPVEGKDHEIWVGFYRSFHSRKYAINSALGAVPIISISMVEMIDHLSLVKWEHSFTAADVNVSVKAPSVALKPLAGTEQTRIASHVEYALHERDAPWVLAWLIPPEDRYALVDIRDYLSVPRTFESWASSSVRIYE
jgi:hypothetical protein